MKEPAGLAGNIGAFEKALEQQGIAGDMIADLVRMAFQFGYFDEYHPHTLKRPNEVNEEYMAIMRDIKDLLHSKETV